MRKHLLPVVLCLCLLLGALPVGAAAADTHSITYYANGGSIGGASYTVYGYPTGIVSVTDVTPIYNNYYFLGWSADPKADRPTYTADGANGTLTRLNLDRDLTMYAVWEPEVRSISVSPKSITLDLGRSAVLTASVDTITGENARVVWSSSNQDVVTVNKDSGNITAIGVGTANVTARDVQNGIYASCCVTVTENSSMRVYFEDVALSIGEQINLDSILPSLGSQWASDDSDIAEVSANNIITAKSTGVTTLISTGPYSMAVCQVAVEAEVLLDANGGHFRRSAVEYAFTTTDLYTTIAYDFELSREGYTLLGWSDSPNDTEALYRDGGKVTVTSDITLYAIWEKEKVANWALAADASWYSRWEDSFVLTTPEELAGLAELVNYGTDFKNVTVYLGDDIDLMGTRTLCHWTPIGTDRYSFDGSFDGCGHTISGLYIDDDTLSLVGLFGAMEDGRVLNLAVTGTVYSNNDKAVCGSIAGYALDSSIENCWANVLLSGKADMGGFCGEGEGLYLGNCWFAGQVDTTGACGALIGVSEAGDVEDCFYLNTAATHAFGSSTSTRSNASAIRAAELRTQEFAAELNEWVEAQHSRDYCTWRYMVGGYPDFNKISQWTGVYDTSWYDSEQVTFTITTPEELAGLSKLVSEGISFNGKEILLGSDINFGSKYDWEPIGISGAPFCGIFDGRGHTVRGLYLDARRQVGLFGFLQNAMVCNVGLKDSDFVQIGADGTMGTIAAMAENSRVLNCWSTALAKADGLAGGIIGVATGSYVLNCWFAGELEGGSIGMIAGQMLGESYLNTCYYQANGTVPACPQISMDSEVTGQSLSAREMQAAAFVDTLNQWVGLQNSEQYYSWTAQDNDYPAFGAAIVPVTAVTLSISSLRLSQGQTRTLEAAVLPEKATFPAVTWSSSNEAVATVSQGVVTAISNGETQITAAAGNKSAVCRIVVGAGELVVADNSCYLTQFAAEKTSNFATLAGQREITAQAALAACGQLGFQAEDITYSFAESAIMSRETTAELLCKLVLAVDSAAPETAVYTDVAVNRWSAGYIAAVTKKGVMDGITNTAFQPDKPVTGAEFCEALLRAVGYLENEKVLPAGAKDALTDVTCRIYLNDAVVDPTAVNNSRYQLPGTLIAGLAATGASLSAELTTQVTYDVTLREYTGGAADAILSVQNTADSYADTVAVSAYTVDGIGNGAITKITAAAPGIAENSRVSVVYYNGEGKFSSATVTSPANGQVVFTTRIFGDFILVPAADFVASDWDPAQRFTRSIAYNGFNDVDESQWYGTQQQGVVQAAVQLGIMNGYVDGSFQPTGNIKLSEVIKMAAVVNDIYTDGHYNFDMTEGTWWYDTYVNYCISRGIIQRGEFSDYEAYATRAQMAYIFANALPTYEAINQVEFSNLPDVTETTAYADDILILYRAGVLTGDAGTRQFRPDSQITRAEAAAIITRVTLVSERQAFSF